MEYEDAIRALKELKTNRADELAKEGKEKVKEIAAALFPDDDKQAAGFVADVFGEMRPDREYPHDVVECGNE